MEAVEEKGQFLTVEAAREYLKTWGGFWQVLRVPNDNPYWLQFRARHLFGVWQEIHIERRPDELGDCNVWEWSKDQGQQWIDAIPAQ